METLKTLLKSGNLKAAFLVVKVVKKIDKDSFIIADSTKVALLDTAGKAGHGKIIKENCWYKLIKCTKGDDKEIVKPTHHSNQ